MGELLWGWPSSYLNHLEPSNSLVMSTSTCRVFSQYMSTASVFHNAQTSYAHCNILIHQTIQKPNEITPKVSLILQGWKVAEDIANTWGNYQTFELQFCWLLWLTINWLCMFLLCLTWDFNQVCIHHYTSEAKELLLYKCAYPLLYTSRNFAI